MTAGTILAAVGVAFAFAIPAIDPRLLTLSLAAVSRGLDVPSGHLGFLAGAATLVMAFSVLAVGNLGDTYGLKRLLRYGLLANIVVALLAALSPNYPVLLVLRIADGLALTALAGLSLALLTVSVPPTVRPVAIGIVMATDAILYGVSPLVGGWLVGLLGWRGLFLVSPMLALVALLLTARYAVESPRQPAGGVDTAGVALFGVALVGLTYGMSSAQNGFGSPHAWLSLAAAGVALAAFVRHERRTQHPALDLGLFARPGFVVALLTVMTIGFLSGGFSLVLGQFGGVILRLSAQEIGMVYLPGTVLLAGLSIVAGHLVAKYSARPVLVTGLLVMAGSGLLVALTAAPTMAVWVLVLATVLLNLGSDLASTPASDTVLSYAPPDGAGSVSAMRSTFGTAGSALGPTIYIVLFNAFFHREWLADAQSRGISAQQAQHQVDAARSSLAHGPGLPGLDPHLTHQASTLTLDWDFSNGVRLTMLAVSAVPAALAIVAYFVMPRRS
ncbi:MFS transporter [Mycolicibacterium palauense]|uniref:MFS transporter n=1 Tax=Mycolicibacterium palauense TaxID=2034511 RepID=UPI000BFEEE46|nr:MFS transporter [Mycolicibacterium palauense]